MLLTSTYTIVPYLGTDQLSLTSRPRQVSNISQYDIFLDNIIAIYATQKSDGSIPVFYKTNGRPDTRSTLTALQPSESYFFILKDTATLPIVIPYAGALISLREISKCPTLDISGSASNISLNSIIGNYFLYYQTINNLAIGDEYQYYIYSIASNWPVRLQPEYGTIKSSQTTNQIVSLLSFQQDTTITNYNTFLPSNADFNQLDKKKLFALIEVRLKSPDEYNCRNVRDTFLVLCDNCIPAPVTPNLTPSITPTISLTPSITPTNSLTPSITPTKTVTATPTSTITPTITSSATPAPTITPTITPTASPQPHILFNSLSWQSVIPEPYLSYFNASAARWANYLRYNPAVINQIRTNFPSWNGLALNVYNQFNDSNTYTIASCGPNQYVDILSGNGNITNLQFNSIDFDVNINTFYEPLFSAQDWINIITHELGHALGIGIYWDSYFANAGAVPPANSFLDGSYYTGCQAAYNSITGSTRVLVPLEDAGGQGTASGHWENNYRSASYTGGNGQTYKGLSNELMVGTIGPGSSRILSSLSIKTLVDFGYVEVNPGTSEGIPTTVNQAITMQQNLGYGLGCDCHQYIDKMVKHTIHIP